MSETKTELLTDPSERRFAVFPIKNQEIYDLYKMQLALFWKPEEIDFSSDLNDFNSLNDDEKHVIKMILAFFASSDGIVNFNISKRLMNEITMTEAIITYQYQMMMENIHNITYSMMLENLIVDQKEREHLFNAINTIPSIKKISDWAFKWIESDLSLGHRIVAFACVEGIFFSGAFATIFWLKKYKNNALKTGSGTFMSGFIKSNEFIARDEGLHYQFACNLYSMIKNKPSTSDIREIIEESVNIAIEFTLESIKCKFIGMNSDLMTQYIKYVADRLAVNTINKKIYEADNPFSFMNTIGMIQKTNFHESRPTEYQNAYTFNTNTNIELAVDF
jgi:ribonucleotide reductase beta subunit family protein with ferritin-like domain